MRRRSPAPRPPPRRSSVCCSASWRTCDDARAVHADERVLIAQEIIRRKRDGHALSDAEIEWFVAAMTRETIGAGKVAAFAMAVFFRGLTRAERVALTRAMARSGRTLDWRAAGLPGPAVDKHSTGGVGDKVSLILAPI